MGGLRGTFFWSTNSPRMSINGLQSGKKGILWIRTPMPRLNPSSAGRGARGMKKKGARMPQVSVESLQLASGIWCIRLNGEVDSSNLSKLKEAFQEIFTQKAFRIILNLGSIKYLSSSAIGVIIGGFTTAVKNRGKLILAGAPLQV